MSFNYEFDKTYLVACSYGPDSMALLNILVENDYRLIVCHVNYHRRPESNLEQKGLETFCATHKLELKVLDTTGLEPKGNFQAWAREIRYQFFKRVYEEKKADGLFVAHQEDDLIETYLIQKARKSLVFYYGIAEQTTIMGMKVLRPLLKKSKASLQRYCRINHVPFSIDSSNLTDHYLRNRIRHNVVEVMNYQQRQSILSEIEAKNLELGKRISAVNATFAPFHELPISQIDKLTDDDFGLVIYTFISKTLPAFPVSKTRANEIRKICQSSKPNIEIPLGHKWVLAKSYGLFRIIPKTSAAGFSYTLEHPGQLDTPYFTLDFTHESKNRNVGLEDYPLTIRTYRAGDEISVGKITKRINRLFIDWKMPADLRKRWPIIVNHSGKPIYVPRFSVGFVSPINSNFKVK